jgi:predicted aldo/keto reductase-like oxidoreductase
MRAFEQLKKSGKTRFVGIGTHSNEPETNPPQGYP